MKELVKDLETDDEDSSTSGGDEKEKMEKARKSLIKLRIRKPKRKLMKLLRDLEKDDDDQKEISQELEDALRSLETSSKTFEIETCN